MPGALSACPPGHLEKTAPAPWEAADGQVGHVSDIDSCLQATGGNGDGGLVLPAEALEVLLIVGNAAEEREDDIPTRSPSQRCAFPLCFLTTADEDQPLLA